MTESVQDSNFNLYIYYRMSLQNWVKITAKCLHYKCGFNKERKKSKPEFKWWIQLLPSIHVVKSIDYLMLDEIIFIANDDHANAIAMLLCFILQKK